MIRAYYNEFDPHAAQWLRELIRAGLIPPGEVDGRSIKEVAADDLRGFEQRHFFAGIGGWCLALQLAGWPADRSVWTGSCPCQPYSSAGKGKGDEDPRNLWPDFFRLIRECRPATVFGEQVEGAIRHGWLDRVSADLEAEGYAVGSCVLGAHSAGAPHIRQRLYWVGSRTVGQADGAGLGRGQGCADGGGRGEGACANRGAGPEHRRGSGFLADPGGQRRQQDARSASGDEAADGRAGRDGGQPDGDNFAGGHGANCKLADAGPSPPRRHSRRRGAGATDQGDEGERERQAATELERRGTTGRVGDTDRQREGAEPGVSGGEGVERPRGARGLADAEGVGHRAPTRHGEAPEGRPADANAGPAGELQARPVGPSGARGVALGDAASERHEGAADGGADAHDAGDGPERHASAASLRLVGDPDGAGPQPGRASAEGNGRRGSALADGGIGGGFWDRFGLVHCRDNKARRVEPGTFPLAHGVPRDLGPLVAVLERMGVDPKRIKRAIRNCRGRLAKAGRNRVGRLRGYGNAIVPSVAAEFIRAFLETEIERAA